MKAMVVAACALGATGASAQQCANFGDVLASSAFCPSVEWVKNRAITTGCGDGSNYCPDSDVTRLSMAAFLQRLGKALSSEVMNDHVTLTGQTIPGEAPTFPSPLVLCDTGVNSTVVPYPRRALLNATMSGRADGNDVAYRVFWVYSTDGGTTFQPIQDAGQNISSPRASSTAGQWSGAALAYALDLPANLPLRVFVGVRRDNILLGTTGNFANVNCQMTVNIINANGTTSPL
jgi:hypothetical protein